MTAAPSIDLVAAADSAHAVAAVYTTSLLVSLPLVLAAVAALALRRSSPDARVLVWRSSLVAMLLIFAGQQLPADGFSWGLPSALASPLVALGRARVSGAPGAPASGDALTRWVLALYLAGMFGVVVGTLVGMWRMRRIVRRGRALRDPAWIQALDEARRALGVGRAVALIASDDVTVPMTWRALRPVLLLPASATDWTGERRRIVLMHEIAHVKTFDAAFNLLARAVCAMFWFHPAAWWLGRRMREDAELAADARVIAAGVRRSDYAEILMDAADRFLPLAPAFAWPRRSGLRARLAVLLDGTHAVAPLGRSWIVAAAMGTTIIGLPMSAVRLAPTRAVLTTLIGDARWESRAYAAIGLANRRDTVEVAREIAEQDPNPRVREWARYALRQQPDSAALRSILQ